VYAVHAAFLLQVIIRGYLAQIVQEWCFFVLPMLLIIGLAHRQAVRSGEGEIVSMPTGAGAAT
jgi:hypothetical protein